MKNTVKTLGLLALVGLAFPVLAAPVAEFSFEASEGFTDGNSPNGVAGWVVEAESPTDPVLVSSTNPADGSQYIKLGEGAVFGYTFSTDQQSQITDLVWVEGYFRGEGSSQTLAEAEQNYANASAIVHFSSTNGIELWNGDGANSGTVVDTDVELGAGNADQWFKITLQLDFTNKEWGIWVNNTDKGQALGFRENSITNLSGFQNLAENQSDFDGFRVIKPVIGDANGDEGVDSADVVRLIEFLTTPPEDDIIVFNNADLTQNGVIDNDDMVVLTGILTGMI